MRKTLLFSLLPLFIISAHSQTVIPRLGLTLSKTNAEEVDPIEQLFNTGFTFGAGVEFPLNSTISIQPELNFVQKGFRIKFTESDQGITVSLDSRTHINYLEIPVLVKFYLNESDTRFYITAGPSLGMGVGGKMKSKVDTDFLGTPLSVTITGKVKFGDPPSDYNPEEDTDIYFDNRFDFGLQGGIGVFIKNSVMVEVRYNHGFSPLYDDDDQSMNRVIQFSAAVPFSVIKNALSK